MAGNRLLMACLLIGTAVAKQAGLHFSLEHPATAYTWACDLVQRLFSKPDCSVVRYDICAFQITRDVAIRFDCARVRQTPFREVADELGIVRKRSKWGLVRAPFLANIAATCCGGHAHSERCERHAEYPAALCHAMADSFHDAWRQSSVVLAEADLLAAQREHDPRPETLLVNAVATEQFVWHCSQ